MTPITLPVRELKSALTGLGKVIARRSTLPVLETVRIHRDRDGWVSLTGTDLDTFATVRLEQPQAGEPATLLVPHPELVKLTKPCSDNEGILVEQPGKEEVLLRYPLGNQTAEQHVDFHAPEEYPPVPQLHGEPVSLNADIRAALLQAMECASDDPTRAILQGACVDVSDRKCQQIVGTNGRHLYASNSFSLALKDSIIIPNHRFLGWKEFNNDGEWQLCVQPEKTDGKGKVEEPALLEIRSRRWQFLTRPVEGNFPNWRQCIPGQPEFRTSVAFAEESIEALVHLVKRLPVAPKDHNQTIGLKVEAGRVFLRAHSSPDGPWTDLEINSAEVTGEPVLICLNREYVLKALTFGLTKLEIEDAKSAMKFSKAGRQLVVMPVRADSTSSAATAPAPTPSGAAANTEPSQPAVEPSAATQERKHTMPKPPTTASNGAEPKPALEAALAQIETVKATLKSSLGQLNELLDTLKHVQREQKASEREVQSVRTTLEKLQTVRL